MGWEDCQGDFSRSFEPETSAAMDIDALEEENVFSQISEPSTPEFAPFSRWQITDFWNPNIGAGLRNLGNTCYLNSVLQCITYTPPLVEALRSCNHKVPCIIEGFCVLCALRNHVELALSSRGKILEPSVLVDNLSNMSSSFQKWEQEDAHDYLHSILEDLDNCVLGTGRFNPSSFLQGSSFVKKIFGGCLRSRIKCTNCSHCSDSFEPFIDLSLEIDEAYSLTNALQSFTCVETVDPDLKYRCDNCHQNATILKQFTISEPSDVLVIQLKRFASNGFFDEKIQKMVAYPQVLDMKPFTSNSQQHKVELKYELYAVLVHAGFSLNSGHYYCFVRSGFDDWYEMDDSQVIRTSEETVLRQQAYILFYFRQGIPWFSDTLGSKEKNESKLFGSPKSVLEETIASVETSRDLSEAESADSSDGICSKVNPDILSNVSKDNLCIESVTEKFQQNDTRCSSPLAVSESPLPVSSCISNDKSSCPESVAEDCKAETYLDNPDSLRTFSEVKHTNNEQDCEQFSKGTCGDNKLPSLLMNTKTADSQGSDKKRLSPVPSQLKRRQVKKWMKIRKGRYLYRTVSSPRGRGRAKNVSPSSKAKRSFSATLQQNAPDRACLLDSDSNSSDLTDQSKST